MLKVGDLAPAFSLPDDTGTIRSLSEFLGSTILVYFYPKDDTPGCTKEACSIRDAWAEFQHAGITVLGISSDTPESHAAFKDKYHLPFTLLSDRDRNVISEYGAKGIGTKRISYLIDKNGTVAKAYPKVDPSSHADEILADAKKL